MPTAPPTPEHESPPEPPSLLQRPPEQRLREYKYRFAQSLVFGLPVVALEIYGRALGGREAERWVSFLQLLLAGWVMYVGAAGMLLEGLLLVRTRLIGDLLIGISAIAMYFCGAMNFVALVTTAQRLFPPNLFAPAVLLIITWTGVQWWRWARRRMRISA